MPDINQNLQMQPFSIGQQGTATFKPNWGQPIVNGQWQGQPQPATPAIDPREVVNTNLQQLRASFKRQADTLRASGLDSDVHNKILAGWQDEYDQAKGKLTGVTAQLDLIQQGVASGEFDPVAAREAELRHVIPGYKPPSVRAGDTLSIGQYGAHVKLAEETGGQTIEKPWLARNYADPDKLISGYRQYRAKIRYNTKSRDEKIQADLAFDEGMGADDRTFTAWQKIMRTNPEVKALRTYDPGLMAEAGKKVLGKSVSPLGKSIARKAFTGKKFRGASAGMTYPYTPKQTQQQNRYSIGTVIQRGGKNYKVVGFDTDGTPMVEEAR